MIRLLHDVRRGSAAALLAFPLYLACAPATQSGTGGSSATTATPAPVMAQPIASGVIPGVEVLITDSLHLVRGMRVGLITNHTGRSRSGASTVDLLHRATGVRLTALYAPEHGLRGTAEAGVHIASSVDSATGVPIYSLYGESHVPTAASLANVDVLVSDLQDVGARVYTYLWTMVIAADSSNKPFIVLDRPNPIRADRVDGGVSEPGFSTLVGVYPVAMRYGLTPGEMLRYLVGTGRVTADIKVIPMKGYSRSMWFEDTKLPWVNPSPNLRDMDASLMYTGTVYFEGVNVSEGRGTDQPFRLVGAPWLTDAGAIVAELNAKGIRGVRFDSTSRTIGAGFEFAGQTIPMVHITITDRNAVNAAEIGLHLLRAIYERHPTEFQWRTRQMDRLAGSSRVRAAVEKEGGVEALLRTMEAESRQFQDATRPYWLYH